MCAIFQDNVSLCNEVSEKVIQHFVRAIARRRHMNYVKVLQTIVKPKGNLIRKCQDLIMTEVSVFAANMLSFCQFEENIKTSLLSLALRD